MIILSSVFIMGLIDVTSNYLVFLIPVIGSNCDIETFTENEQILSGRNGRGLISLDLCDLNTIMRFAAIRHCIF